MEFNYAQIEKLIDLGLMDHHGPAGYFAGILVPGLICLTDSKSNEIYSEHIPKIIEVFQVTSESHEETCSRPTITEDTNSSWIDLIWRDSTVISIFAANSEMTTIGWYIEIRF